MPQAFDQSLFLFSLYSSNDCTRFPHRCSRFLQLEGGNWKKVEVTSEADAGKKRTKVQTKQNIVFPEKEKSDGPRKGHSQSPLFSTGKKSTFHILE